MMIRENEIKDCLKHISDSSVDHLHIRKRAIVGEFIHSLESEYSTNGGKVITVDVSGNGQREVTTTAKHELQKELGLIRYYANRLTSGGLSLLGLGFSAGFEGEPDYSAVEGLLNEVSAKTENGLILLINNYGNTNEVDFNWISKLQNVPDDATIVTHGFQQCTRDHSEVYDVGRFSPEQTFRYLEEEIPELSEEKALEIHKAHDGNPIALQIASDVGSLEEPLTGEHLDKLWEEVYDNKLSARERDLLLGSGHLVDLDYRDVAMTVNMTRGECEEVLQKLENKGVVSKKKAGLFTTDRYVKDYILNQISEKELMENHRTSFENYVERWVEYYHATIEDVSSSSESDKELTFQQTGQGLSNPNLYFGIYHLANLHSQMTIEAFIKEIKNVDADSYGLFIFGMQAQRFFFEEPVDVIKQLSDSLLGFAEDVDSDLFTGTVSLLLDPDPKNLIAELSKGWTGDITTDELATGTSSEPEEIVKKIQKGIDSNLFDKAPVEVKVAISHLAAMLFTSGRKTQQFYYKFGKTASNYGLEEEPFKNWLNEVNSLLDVMDPDLETIDDNPQQVKEDFDQLDREIRDRVELEEYLEENQSEAQQKFQKHIKTLREQPDEITDQFITCGEQLSETPNPLFPYLWYAFGANAFTKVVLGGFDKDIYGNYREWLGTRRAYENSHDGNIAIQVDEIEESLEKMGLSQ